MKTLTCNTTQYLVLVSIMGLEISQEDGTTNTSVNLLGEAEAGSSAESKMEISLNSMGGLVSVLS